MDERQSIIVLYHKDKDMLRFCLKRLLTTTPSDVEIIVYGNNNNKEELDIKFENSRIKYYVVQENLQYPKALNQAVEKASGEIITFVDADAFVWDGWYEPLLSLIMRCPEIAVVSSKLLNPRTNRILDFGIMYTKFNSAHTLMGARSNHPLAMSNRKVQAACSAILMTRKPLYNLVGGMDEDMPYSYVDCDYCLKLAERGYETWVCASSKAYHKGSTDSNNSKSRFSYYHGDAKGMFGFKDYPRLSDDLAPWFLSAGRYARETYKEMQRSFLFIDFSSMYDKKYYQNLLRESLNVEFLDTWVVAPEERDQDQLVLHTTLSYACLDLVTPIFYFVDSFISLLDNALWFKARDISNDFVADRHGNFMPLESISNGSV